MHALSLRSRFLLSLYVVAALFFIFWLPRLIESPPSFSSSYIFKYNNRAGIVLLVAFAAGFGVLARRAGYRFPEDGKSDRIDKKVFWISIAASLLACLGMYLLTAWPGSFGESAYLINRLGLTASGLRPYRDFEFAYGVSLLYGPLLLGKVLHIGFVNSYYLLWTVDTVSGVWLLKVVIDAIDYPGRRRTQIFLMLFAILLVATITTGANYAGLRFLTGPALALWICHLVRSRRYALGALATWVSMVILLLLSPEFAVGFVVALYVYLFFFWSREGGWGCAYPYAAILPGVAGVLWLASRLDVFRTFEAFAVGGLSLPIVPALHILLLFFTVFLAAAYMASNFIERKATNTGCLLLIAAASLPSALGHCDPGHVILNGLPFVVGAFLWASRSSRSWVWFRAAYLLVLLICSATFLAGYAGQLWRASLVLRMQIDNARSAELMAQYRQKMTARYGDLVAKEKVAELELMRQTDATRNLPWKPHATDGIVEAPFGYPLNLNRAYIDEGYYAGVTNAFNPDQVAAKIEELKRHPDRELLIAAEQNCFLDTEAQKRFLSVLFFYHFRWTAVHPESVYAPLCRYVDENYTVRVAANPDTYGFTVWSPKPRR